MDSIEWTAWNGRRCDQDNVYEKAAEALKQARSTGNIGFCWGGDSLVLAIPENGYIQLVSCIVMATTDVKAK